ncbi:MAG: universal stress protein [Actinomycetota bacterium]|nr:universal stress protein [Actinomycetota bacterium]
MATFMPDASVAIVTVAEPIYRDARYAGFADPDAEKRQQDALEEARALIAQSGIAATTAAPVGQPGDEIVRTATEAKADLVVLGARGLSSVKRLVLGSVSTKVLHEAHCDVLVVK